MSIEGVNSCFRSSMPSRILPIHPADYEYSLSAADASHSHPPPSFRSDQCLSVLWIDDEIETNDALLRLLAIGGARTDLAGSGAMGVAMARANRYDAILLDLRLPDLFGLTVLERLVAAERRTPVVVVTGYYFEPELHADAMRRGAAAFLHKPIIGADDLIAMLRSVIRIKSGTSLEPGQTFGIVAASQPMRAMIDWVRRVAPTGMSVLLTGETGTGKELAARALHDQSERRKARFVPINCAAIPEALVESELFGHREGAFTGATAAKQGLFETAAGGTLFPDEVGELPLPMNGKFGAVLEEGAVCA